MLKYQKMLSFSWQFRLLLILFFVCGLINISCKKSTSTYESYYVKYEVNSSTIYTGGKLNLVFKNDNNQEVTMIINTRSPWEITIGPVKKGYSANLNVSEIGNNYGRLTLQSQISVSKNGSAFALKKFDNSSTPRTSLQINYTIDY